MLGCMLENFDGARMETEKTSIDGRLVKYLLVGSLPVE